MDLNPQYLRDALGRVEIAGWDSQEGARLLEDVRRSVVLPVVRRSGLRGPAADQAAATAWAAAWDALRRPSARTAENPGGMVWVAVRRAVAAEGGIAPAALSLEQLTAAGWEPATVPTQPDPGAGPIVAAIVNMLVAQGWDRGTAGEAVALLADSAASDRTGAPMARWRWVALRLGLPQWQVHRLAGLLLGGPDWPGALELGVVHGPEVLADAALRAAARSTAVRWSAGPGAWLAGWGSPTAGKTIA